MAPKQPDQAVLILPVSLVGRIDVIRLAREVEQLGNLLDQEARHDQSASLPPISRMLAEVIQINHLDPVQPADRQRLYNFLQDLKSSAPQLHMSFAAEPTSQFTAKLVTWLRDEIHPMLLLEVGLQPSIAAGCIIRTTNKIIDCSMRQHLLKKRSDLLQRLMPTAAAPQEAPHA